MLSQFLATFRFGAPLFTHFFSLNLSIFISYELSDAVYSKLKDFLLGHTLFFVIHLVPEVRVKDESTKSGFHYPKLFRTEQRSDMIVQDNELSFNTRSCSISVKIHRLLRALCILSVGLA